MSRPTPPYPDLVRKPTKSFGWLDARLLHEQWLSRIGPEATAVLVFLAIAADRQGASFHGRDRIATQLTLSRDELDRALTRLLELGLVAMRPWRPAHSDGIWQLLPLPPKSQLKRSGKCMSMEEILARLENDA